MRIVRIVRTFHPVGQGAFYSERFYFDGHKPAAHNIVYDCGTSLGQVGKVKSVVTQAFGKDDVIDYLFISHLDYDHISLVQTLLSSVKGVRNIVLPLVPKDVLMTEMALCQIAEQDEAVSFLSRVIGHLRGEHENDYYHGDYNIHFVAGEESVDNEVGRAHVFSSGVPRVADWDANWVFIPYNMGFRSRKKELIDKLDKALASYNDEARAIGEEEFPSGKALYDRLKDDLFVGRIITIAKLKNVIKSAYEKLPDGINKNSLLLYSGPAKGVDRYFIRRIVPACYDRRWFFRYNAGCLYTGDNDWDLQGWMNKPFADVWENIGTIQTPHHGSRESFDVAKNPINSWYYFPVSFGTNNSFGHPSGKVLSYLLANGCVPVPVTEQLNTAFYQTIVG